MRASVCPFMAVGTLAQEFVTSMDVQLKKWPQWGQTFGPTFAFGLFYAILMWEELWDLPQNGALSACLLLLITAGAVVGSVTYEKRLWCRYFCPIGAMNKMFATLAMAEVRTWKSNWYVTFFGILSCLYQPKTIAFTICFLLVMDAQAQLAK